MLSNGLKSKRLLVLVGLIGVLLFTAACRGQEVASWPGIESDGERIYVAYRNQLLALEADGSIIWDYPGSSGNAEFYAKPLIENERVYIGDYGVSGGIFSGGSFVTQIHAIENGTQNPPNTAWVVDDVVTGRVYAGSLVVDDTLYLGTANNFFLAVDTSNGAKKWEYQTQNAIWDKPAHLNGVIYFSALDKNIYALSADDGAELWVTSLPGASASTPLIDEARGVLYVGSFDGALNAIDLETGEVAWKAPADDWVWGSPILGEDAIYYGDTSGNVYAVSADDGSSLWSAQVPGSILSEAAISGSTLIVTSGDTSAEADPGAITAFSVDDGAQLWQNIAPAAMEAAPVIIGDIVVTAYASNDVPLEIVGFAVEDGGSRWKTVPSNLAE